MAASAMASFASSVPTSVDLVGCGADGLSLLARPIHVLVASPSARRRSRAMASHSWTGGLPHGAFVRVARDVHVCSPELSFVQAASTMGLVPLVELGDELCGTYALCPGLEDGFRCRDGPLTTRARLVRAVGEVAGATGAKRARSALRHVMERSASPMETVLAMLLCLPRRLGGYGLPRPELNARIDTGGDARALTGKACFLGDLYWRADRLDVEYDSTSWHSGERSLRSDSARRNGLASMGIDVLSVTSDQVFDVRRLDAVARLIARRIHYDLRRQTDEVRAVRTRLRRDLLSPCLWRAERAAVGAAAARCETGGDAYSLSRHFRTN